MAASKKQIDMTQGSIAKQFLLFAAPLLLGDMLQQFYNTIDSIIVGNFVSKQALAAVGATSPIVNILIGFCIGISTGATVIISRRFGAKDKEGLKIAVITTFWLSVILGVLFTGIGVGMTPFMLKVLATPADVMPVATEYLTIYFGGILGLIMYNMCSGILRAVGDSRRPLYVLIFSSILNIILDLIFIIPLKMGVAGAAYATIISQFLSASVLIYMMYHTDDFAPLDLHHPILDKRVLSVIFGIGLPFGLQRSIISFSNTVVLSYVNRFGSGAMAAWSAHNKVDHVIFQTIQSMSAAVTTFVSQNLGAQRHDRIKKGIKISFVITVAICTFYAFFLIVFRHQLIALFNREADVIYYGSIALTIFGITNPINAFIQIKAAVMRGYGRGKLPMFIMLFCYVVVRQIYLHIGWQYIQSFEFVVFSFPFSWAICAAIMWISDYITDRLEQKSESLL
ncbi:MAG: MATE family efflux transporter [Oscillospiraceae bacterium]|nr:MATE family efflux transporter [Oscillospiraceae bacterium]